ncbi:hypothetical protein PN466_02750 [Roseofilum reptotaenium CS-1145]|nr:hypothetical protein [Roseofilum reptotaenium CS-1145]
MLRLKLRLHRPQTPKLEYRLVDLRFAVVRCDRSLLVRSRLNREWWRSHCRGVVNLHVDRLSWLQFVFGTVESRDRHTLAKELSH